MQVGDTLRNHVEAPTSYIPDGDPGRFGGGTYTSNNVEPTLEAYENIFGPSARDIKQDLQRFKRHGRWHLPDILKGPNQYLTDRVDGLITDATNSPFTSRILPYKYIVNVDGKIKWNVWSFDEGLASRVPYEAAARTLQQSKRSYAGYFLRHGMAIVLEHNFMMTEAGRENFRRQLQQLVGSIQLTNDLDVHVALVLAPSYQKTMNEKYMSQDKSSVQICREFVEMFGFVQKNQNALDILIEEAKGQLRTWGSPMPDFMLCNSKLTFQLNMIPDRTNIVTQGPEGAKRLKAGPEMSSYRGIGIVHTRAFSMETGTPPRDILRRRVRVAEYYRILPHRDNYKKLFQLYNEERDTWSTFTFADLLQKAHCANDHHVPMDPSHPGTDNDRAIRGASRTLGSAVELPDEGRDDGEHSLVHRAGGGHLGAVMTDRDAPRMIHDSLAKLFLQLLTPNQTKKTFTWSPMPLTDNLVFVPGAVDATSLREFNADYSNPNVTSRLPEFYQPCITKFFSAGSISQLRSLQEITRAKLLMQSVASYPRDYNAHVNSIFANNHAFIFNAQISPTFTGFFDALQIQNAIYGVALPAGMAAVNAGVAREQLNLLVSLHMRNFNRYGVPNQLTGDTTAATIEEGLRLGQAINAYDITNQRLRDMGAWHCPNHFKNSTNAKVFTRFGDFLGFHSLLCIQDISAFLTRRSRFDAYANWHMGTLLHDIVLQKEIKYRVWYDLVKTELTRIMPLMAGNRTRAQLWEQLTGIFRNLQATPLFQSFTLDPTTGAQHPATAYDVEPYWMFPRTSNTSEEVFVANARAADAWKNQLYNMNVAAAGAPADFIFLRSWNITEIMARHMVRNPASVDTTSHLSVNYSVNVPNNFPPVTDQDVTQLFNMLAWRLFADQEIPLENVYDVNTGVWPTFDHYVHPPLNGVPLNFAQGLMTYDTPPMVGPGAGVSLREAKMSKDTEDIEIVIVRPNIEHYMLGIILGQGGESLGSTFWGQTELSCYDDSMHGIWGMSYKYHERAIVINERNLIRLWDVAYDGYVGGKDDTSVDWDAADETNPNSRHAFMRATTDVTRPYRGPSMMVMAFNHRTAKVSSTMMGGSSVYKDNFNSNWPSPIVYYDQLSERESPVARADFDNLHVVDTANFRVFNNPLYRNAYAPYKEKMPNFYELHTIRKNAGLAAVENEVSSDALAFQGTMRVLSADTGAVLQETLGSGHHGPDFIGVASLRAGKGYRINSQPTLQRLT
jgi:hypothetical protein